MSPASHMKIVGYNGFCANRSEIGQEVNLCPFLYQVTFLCFKSTSIFMMSPTPIFPNLTRVVKPSTKVYWVSYPLYPIKSLFSNWSVWLFFNYKLPTPYIMELQVLLITLKEKVLKVSFILAFDIRWYQQVLFVIKQIVLLFTLLNLL